jgi:hypothetical protein
VLESFACEKVSRLRLRLARRFFARQVSACESYAFGRRQVKISICGDAQSHAASGLEGSQVRARGGAG